MSFDVTGTPLESTGLFLGLGGSELFLGAVSVTDKAGTVFEFERFRNLLSHRLYLNKLFFSSVLSHLFECLG